MPSIQFPNDVGSKYKFIKNLKERLCSMQPIGSEIGLGLGPIRFVKKVISSLNWFEIGYTFTQP